MKYNLYMILQQEAIIKNVDMFMERIRIIEQYFICNSFIRFSDFIAT